MCLCVAQSCPTFCDLMDGSLSGFSAHGEWGCHAFFQLKCCYPPINHTCAHVLLSPEYGQGLLAWSQNVVGGGQVCWLGVVAGVALPCF